MRAQDVCIRLFRLTGMA